MSIESGFDEMEWRRKSIGAMTSKIMELKVKNEKEKIFDRIEEIGREDQEGVYQESIGQGDVMLTSKQFDRLKEEFEVCK